MTLNTVMAVVKEGKIELLENISLPEGHKVLVTVLPEDEKEFWMLASQSALESVWHNDEDDVYWADKVVLQKQMRQLMSDMQITGEHVGVETLQLKISQESQLIDNEMSRNVIEMRDE